MSRALILAAVAFACVLAPASVSAQTSSAPAHHTARPATGDPTLFHPSLLKAKAPDVYEVKFTTTKGDFVIQVTRAWAPLGADRFYNLVKHHYFNNNSFFRVVPGFVVQFGLSPSPAINKALQNATIADDPVTQSNRVGTITFATSGPNSRTTQVFISLGDNSSLDSQGFAPFGQVTSGMDVVQQLFSGYGDLPEMGGNGPREDAIAAQGKQYLDKNFPKLDSIVSASIISPVPASPSHTAPKKPAAASGAASPGKS